MSILRVTESWHFYSCNISSAITGEVPRHYDFVRFVVHPRIIAFPPMSAPGELATGVFIPVRFDSLSTTIILAVSIPPKA